MFLGVDNIDVVLIEFKWSSFVVTFGTFTFLAILASISLESFPSLLNLGFVMGFRTVSQGVTFTTVPTGDSDHGLSGFW